MGTKVPRLGSRGQPMSMCQLDGSVKTVIDRDRYSVSYRCPWCGQHSIEELEANPTDLLQREYDR